MVFPVKHALIRHRTLPYKYKSHIPYPTSPSAIVFSQARRVHNRQERQRERPSRKHKKEVGKNKEPHWLCVCCGICFRVVPSRRRSPKNSTLLAAACSNSSITFAPPSLPLLLLQSINNTTRPPRSSLLWRRHPPPPPSSIDPCDPLKRGCPSYRSQKKEKENNVGREKEFIQKGKPETQKTHN